MIRTVSPGFRSGEAAIPASKSRAHRLLICAALSTAPTELTCRGISADIAATVACLRGMGSDIQISGDRITVRPVSVPKGEVLLPCGESGSTLRFLLPVAGALGLRGEFLMEGRLPQRPMEALEEALRSGGMETSHHGDRLRFAGKLRPGDYEIPGNISSQYISGLLFALPLPEGESTLTVTGRMESADYVAMTEDALAQAGVALRREGNRWRIPARGYARPEHLPPRELKVEADWSSASYFLSMGALSPAGMTVTGMDLRSRQGDRRILDLLEGFGAEIRAGEDRITVRRGTLRGQEIDASDIPDLVPVLAAVAAVSEGTTVIRHAERLRIKESDRLQTTCAMLSALGADVRETEDGLILHGKESLEGGTVSSFRDHRIAMSAATAASACREPVTVTDAECTEKSFPGFWELLRSTEQDGTRKP